MTAIQRQEDDTYEITTAKGNFKTRWVVNCAGLGCGKIADMLGITGYRIIGSKGDYIILDKRTVFFFQCLFIQFQATPIWEFM